MAYCSTCSAELKPNARFCTKCGTTVEPGDAASNTAPSQAGPIPVVSSLTAAQMLIARRVGARMIDWVIVAVVVWQASVLFKNVPVVDGRQVAAILSVVVYFAYFGYLESEFGYTLGKRLLGIRVEAMDGSLPTVGQAIIRNALFAVLNVFGAFIEFVTMLAMGGPRLGDLLAKTRAVAHDYTTAIQPSAAQAPPQELDAPPHE